MARSKEINNAGDEHAAISAIYQLERVIGKGGSGRIWAATHRATGEPVAIKVVAIPEDKRSAAKVAKALRLEMEVQSSLSHSGILRLREVYTIPGCWFYMVMDRCEGDLLGQVMASPFSDAETRRIVLELCSSLAYMSSQGVTHRDLKCENILLRQGADGRSSPVIADFGVSRRATSGMTDVCGSILYVPPEVLDCLDSKDPKPYGAKCDMWSLGVTVFVMLTGQPPFDASSHKAVTAKIRAHAVSPMDFEADPRLAHVSADLRRLVALLLSGNPTARPTADDVLRWMARAEEEVAAAASPMHLSAATPLPVSTKEMLPQPMG